MKISDLAKETFSAIGTNKVRSCLTILGIVIGIAAVIAMTSLIGGMKQSLISQLGLDQSRVVYIDYYTSREKTLDDLRVIKDNILGYDFITAVQYETGKAASSTAQKEASIMGVGTNFFTASGLKLSEGRLLSNTELSGEDRVVVIDATIAKNLFRNISPTGKTIEIKNDTFNVVGVVESSNKYSEQGIIYMPINTCAIRIAGYSDFSQIIGYAKEGYDIDQLVGDTRQFLTEEFEIDEDEDLGYLNVESIESMQKDLSATLKSFQMMMIAVAAISLLVGGVGIMNMMLTNVVERVREIGLRKALGARKIDIVAQFLCESIIVCLIGGILGSLIGYGASWALSGVASDVMGDAIAGESVSIAPYFSVEAALISVAICAGIGIVFGLFPAYRAAKLNPIECLRWQ